MKPLDTLKAMSPDALGALESAGISRRKFIKGSGALIISFSMGGLASPPGAAPGQAVPPDFNGPGSGQLDSWIAIGADGASVAWQAHIGGFFAGLVLFSLFDPVPRAATNAADASSRDVSNSN